MSKKIILIGPCGGGGVPKNGASAKNYHLAKYLADKGVKTDVVDTENWRKNPSILFVLFFKILFNSFATFIVATDNMSGYRVMRAFSLFPKKKTVIYWVIGGSIADWIKIGKVKSEPYKIVNNFLVEGRKMQKTFAQSGFDNTIYVPNFKHIDYLPAKKGKINNITKFIFLSRIIPQKGCDIIFKAVDELNKVYSGKFIVDFYGPIEDSYAQNFQEKVVKHNNVNYHGFLDLRQQNNYDTLAGYDAMLFPTYWDGEGFPGIIIDAFIAGLPVVATDWSLNSDIIEDGKTGVILDVVYKSQVDIEKVVNGIIPFDEGAVVAELVSAMKDMIDNPDTVKSMSISCQESALKYDIKNVLTTYLFQKIGITL